MPAKPRDPQPLPKLPKEFTNAVADLREVVASIPADIETWVAQLEDALNTVWQLAYRNDLINDNSDYFAPAA